MRIANIAALLCIGCNQAATPSNKPSSLPPDVKPSTVATTRVEWDTIDATYSGATKDRLGKDLGKPDFTSDRWWYYDDKPGKKGQVDVSIYFDKQGHANTIQIHKANPNRIRQNDD